MKKWGTKSSFVLQTWKKLITESDVCVFLPLCPSIDTSPAHRKYSAADWTHGSLCFSRPDTFLFLIALCSTWICLVGADGMGATFGDEVVMLTLCMCVCWGWVMMGGRTLPCCCTPSTQPATGILREASEASEVSVYPDNAMLPF